MMLSLTEVCLRLALSCLIVLSVCSQERMAFLTFFFHECTENIVKQEQQEKKQKEGVNMAAFNFYMDCTHLIFRNTQCPLGEKVAFSFSFEK